MVTCCVVSCGSSQSKHSTHSFHRFPKDPDRRREWVSAVGRENWEPGNHTKICSKHFDDSFVVKYSMGRTGLTENAVPTQFLQNTGAEPPKGIKRKLGLDEDDISPREQRLMDIIESSYMKAIEYRKKIRLLTQKNKRNRDIINRLKCINKKLLGEKMLTKEETEVIENGSDGTELVVERQVRTLVSYDKKQSKKMWTNIESYGGDYCTVTQLCWTPDVKD